MKSLFDPEVFQDTVRRIEALQPSAPRQWGKMTPAQMLEHAARVVEMACGKGHQKQIWPGKLFSWTFRRNFLGEQPFGKNAPTGRDFVIQNEPEFAAVKARLLVALRIHGHNTWSRVRNLRRFPYSSLLRRWVRHSGP